MNSIKVEKAEQILDFGRLKSKNGVSVGQF